MDQNGSIFSKSIAIDVSTFLAKYLFQKHIFVLFTISISNTKDSEVR